MNDHTSLFNPAVVAYQPSLIRKIMETKHNGSYTRISLGLGELPYVMPEAAQHANTEALANGKSGYTPNVGLTELREAVAKERTKQSRKSYAADNVLITSGSTGGLAIAFETLLTAGDEVLIPALHYPLYASLPKTRGGVVREYHLTDDFQIDVDHLQSLITEKTKLIVINSPSNPTGAIQSSETLQRVADLVTNHPHIFFISDEVYSTLRFTHASFPSIADYSDNTIIIDGLSKRANMTGKRVGWFIAPDYVIEQARKVQQYLYVCAPSDSQYAALAILSGSSDSELSERLEQLERNRDVLLDSLNGIEHVSVNHPEGAFYCLLDISYFGDSQTVAKRLIEEVNVVTVPGVGFGRSGDRYLRLSFAVDQSSLQEAVARMKGVFASW